MDKFAEQLGFTPTWFAAGIVNEEILARIKIVWDESDDRNTEHYRWGAFCDFLKSQPSLSPALATALYALGDSDRDVAMGGSMMALVLRRPDCPAELLDSAERSRHVHLVKLALKLRAKQ